MNPVKEGVAAGIQPAVQEVVPRPRSLDGEILSFLLLNNFTLTIARPGSAQFHTGAAWNNEAYFTVSATTHTQLH